MKFSGALVIFLALLLSCSSAKMLFEPEDPTWFEKGDAKWQFGLEGIVGSSNGGIGFLMTKEPYRDFELELEFYPDETVNSGIFVRCKNYDLSFSDCYEINIWDNHPDQKNRTGAIVSRTTPLAQVETLNQWNTYSIKCEKNHIQAWVNGVLTADLISDDLREGYIGLQTAETGTIKFRNVRIRPF